MQMRSLAALGALCVAAGASPLFAPLKRAIYAGAPLSLNTSQYQFVVDETINLLGDFDAVSIDLTNYGIPWNSFLYEEPLPVSWSERLYAAVAGVDSYDLPVILSFSMNGNGRASCPASNATDIAGTTSPGVDDFSGCQQCFDYNVTTNPIASFVRQAFVNYVSLVALAFNTTGTLGAINFAVDYNRYLRDGCPAENWASFKDFTLQVRETLKSYLPEVLAFASANLEEMVQIGEGQACASTDWTRKTAPAALLACAASGYAQLAGVASDTFAWSSYPSISSMGPAGGPPAWYLQAALSALSPQARFGQIIAGTGLLATPLAVDFANSPGFEPPLQCNTLIPSSDELAGAWFSQIAAAATWTSSSQVFIVNLRTARDLLFDGAMACPCTASIPALQPYCDVILAYRAACFANKLQPAQCELSIKSFGSMGVRTLFNEPREPLYSLLQAARKV